MLLHHSTMDKFRDRKEERSSIQQTKFMMLNHMHGLGMSANGNRKRFDSNFSYRQGRKLMGCSLNSFILEKTAVLQVIKNDCSLLYDVLQVLWQNKCENTQCIPRLFVALDRFTT